jgi:PAS domain-containing protein
MRFAETNYSSPGQLDFIPRSRSVGIWKLIPAFSIITAILLLMLLAPETIGNKNVSALITISVVSFLCFHIIYRKQQNLDLVMATEYQNMLFAQAATLGFSFCMFVRRDGTIVYANDGLRTMFKNFDYGESSALEGLFHEGNIAPLDRERLMDTIYSSSSAQFIFPLCPTGSTMRDYVISIDPLVRPGGFLVIRGREYLGARTGAQIMPPILRNTSAEKIDYLLTHSPVAQYITDPFGRIEYATPALTMLLGYYADEIVHSRIAIHQLFYQLNGVNVPDDYTLAEHQCDALFNQKHGGLAPVTLTQRIMRNAEGKIIGAIGYVQPSSLIPS